ncbi:TPA: helix-turn-helix transcriptional regulator [Enterococcus hirae]|uniref:Cro/CI family transcriptional regulator n=2 Tax=Enterococcus hirae TaxID=1354 RepID=A0A7Z9DJK6_ENTHR|nr:helix-turn-helix transcriptional regulator [Enterococcus hirae]AEJ87167.1 hypothetical protein EHR_3005 [Enterococcus hirae ATCC 9790]EOH66953.1 hypothetical protein UAE_02757 [Enterococcus hirae ATCC 9790]EOU03368.1 hypothetical protein I584_02741 [Enterococcus hirae ATCC 9790]OJG49224.1 hypothetical protein RV05_GL001354 [Enterococcus hirae]QQY20797.1 helix-turn-helix transcriptional regulator [Enterococcus hirae]
MDCEEEKLKSKYFSKKLRKLRLEHGFVIEEVALLLGVSGNTIRNYETNNGKPSIDRLIKLANVFNVSLDYFFTE